MTHSRDVSADLVIRHLLALGCTYVRLDTDRLGTPACYFGAGFEPELYLHGRKILSSDVTAIWARRFALPEVLRQVTSEHVDFVRRELSVIMDAFLEGRQEVFQINSAHADRQAGNRILQAQRAKKAGIAVPESLVTQDCNLARQFLERHPEVICKALSFGRISSVPNSEMFVYTTRASKTMQLQGLECCPTLFQQRIVKKFDWRITTIGNRAFSARAEVDESSSSIDWRQDKNATTKFVRADPPSKVLDQLFDLAKNSGIIYGAHDLLETSSGEFYFLETNPAGQWGWIELTANLPIGRAIAEELAAHSAW